jgi:AraC-like DNA-binding protein
MPRQISVDAICRLIDVLLTRGYPTIAQAAQFVGVSPRTFQRLLNVEGVSYAELVERCRYKAACKSLEHTRDSVKDIAAALGYRDASSFTRAFRRWTSRTPREYRKQSLGRQGDRARHNAAPPP